MRGGILRGFLDLGVASAGRAIGDVGADRVVEEEGFLRDERTRRAQRTERYLAHILTVDQDAALCRIVEAGHEVEDRALARARGADKRDRMPFRNFDIDAVERRRSVAVVEMHVLEADRAIGDLERLRIVRCGNRRLDVENGEDARGRRDALMHESLRVGELLERFVGEQHGREEAAEIADGKEARLHAAPAEIDHGRDADARKDAGHGACHAAGLERLDRMMTDEVDGAGGAVDLRLFLVICLDDADALERFRNDGGEIAGAFHVAFCGLACALAELAHDDTDHGNDRGAHQRELPVEPEHGADQRDDGEQILAEIDHRCRDGVADAVRIVEEAGEKTARMRIRYPGEVRMHDAREHALLNGGDDALADGRHVDARDIGRDRLNRRRGDGTGGNEEQHPCIRADDIVERELDQHRNDACRARDHDARGERHGRHAPVRLEIFPRHAGDDIAHTDLGRGWRRRGIGEKRRPLFLSAGLGVGGLARHSGLSLRGAPGALPCHWGPLTRAGSFGMGRTISRATPRRYKARKR